MYQAATYFRIVAIKLTADKTFFRIESLFQEAVGSHLYLYPSPKYIVSFFRSLAFIY